MADQDAPDRLAEIRRHFRDDWSPHWTDALYLLNRVDALTQAHSTLTAEVSRLTKELLREGQAHYATINQRDDAQEWADQLASVAGGVEEIGEHSNINNPWRNALELLEAQSAEVSRLRDEIARVFTVAAVSSIEDAEQSYRGLQERVRFTMSFESVQLENRTLREEIERLKTPRHETFEQWWEAKPALPAQTIDRLEPIRDDELKQVELGCMGWLLAESGHAASLRLSRILLRLHKAEQETVGLRTENERLKADGKRKRIGICDCGHAVTEHGLFEDMCFVYGCDCLKSRAQVRAGEAPST